MNEIQIQKPTLEEVFAPRGIAVVGASASGRLGFAEMIIVANLETKFPGLYAVNPKYKEVYGVPCYPSILDIPGVVDHVVVNIPAQSALKLLDECAEKGVRSVHFFTAGFSESGYAERADLEVELLKKARQGGYRIIGPNCVGLFVPKSRVSNTISVPTESGPIAFISQSGGHANNIPMFSAVRGLRYSKVVSYGNALDIDEVELLEYLTDDNETEIIGAYIEGVKDGNRFFNALKGAADKKPVIVYKGGKTEAGLRAAHGHTASMISSVDVFEAVCRQANAIQVENTEELLDVFTVLRFVRQIPQGKNVALFGAGGGPSVLAGDEIENAGLCMPQFSQKVQDDLKQVLPVDGGIFTNPLDTTNLVSPEAVDAAAKVLGKVTEIHMLVYHLGFHPIGMWGRGSFSEKSYLDTLLEVMKMAVKKSGKPILVALRPAQDLNGMKEFLTVQEAFVDAGFPIFYSLGQLALAMNRVIDWNDRFAN